MMSRRLERWVLRLYPRHVSPWWRRAIFHLLLIAMDVEAILWLLRRRRWRDAAALARQAAPYVLPRRRVVPARRAAPYPLRHRWIDDLLSYPRRRRWRRERTRK